jgi:hypothetical protein
MSSSVPEQPQEATGRNPSGRFLSLDQESLFEAPTVGWMLFLRRIIRGESLRKAIGSRCYPNRDPEGAADNLARILEEKNDRHFHVSWLDFIAEALGAEGREAIVRFVTDRYGYEMPAKKPDPVRVQEELAAVKTGLGEAITAIKKLTTAVDHIEKALR